MKSILSKTGVYLIDFAAALWVGVLIDGILITPIRLIFEPTLFQERIVSGIIQLIGTVAWLFVSAWKIAYEKRQFSLPQVVIPAIFAFALQLPVAYLCHFVQYTSGPAGYLTEAIYWGNRAYRWERWDEVPLYIYFGLMLAFDLLYLAAMIAGEYFGAKKRQKNRAKLTAEHY